MYITVYLYIYHDNSYGVQIFSFELIWMILCHLIWHGETLLGTQVLHEVTLEAEEQPRQKAPEPSPAQRQAARRKRHRGGGGCGGQLMWEVELWWWFDVDILMVVCMKLLFGTRTLPETIEHSTWKLVVAYFQGLCWFGRVYRTCLVWLSGKSDMLDRTGHISHSMEMWNYREFHRKISGFQVTNGSQTIGLQTKKWVSGHQCQLNRKPEWTWGFMEGRMGERYYSTSFF